MQRNPVPWSAVARRLALMAGITLFGALLYLRYVPQTSSQERHPHTPWAQGGILVSLGDDRYHVEAVVSTEGTVELLALGPDTERVIDVEAQTLSAYVRAESDVTATMVELKASPQRGDAPGRTSRWSGRLPERLHGQPIAVTIPVVRFGRERFRVAFDTGMSRGHVPMPRGVGESELAQLYLRPAGRYREADIEANGRTVPAIRYQKFRARHDVHPKTGDALCPVSRTKANPDCTWVIDGRTYQFCCPPCIDEFVKRAKEHPDEIRPPDDYVQQ